MGVPLPNAMIKLVDAEEMKYFAANNEGEVSINRLYSLCNGLVKEFIHCILGGLEMSGWKLFVI